MHIEQQRILSSFNSTTEELAIYSLFPVLSGALYRSFFDVDWTFWRSVMNLVKCDQDEKSLFSLSLPYLSQKFPLLWHHHEKKNESEEKFMLYSRAKDRKEQRK